MRQLINGQVAQWPAPVGPALVHGDGVFRTLLVWDGVIVDAAAQHAILCADAQRLGLSAAPLAVWLADSAQALAGAPRAALRWWLAHGDEVTTHPGDMADEAVVRWVVATPLPPRPSEHWTQGIRAGISTVRLSAPVELAGIKHLNRLPQRLAARDWLPDQAEALLCDDADDLVCGTRSNFFWVSQGRLFTPALDRVGVEGLMRRKIAAMAETLGLRFAPGRISPAELDDAEELFVTNSLIGLWPIRVLGARQWPAPGPVARRLLTALQHPLANHMWEARCGD